MISREQLKAEIDEVDSNNFELLHNIIKALRNKSHKIGFSEKSATKERKPLKGSIIFENDIISPIDDKWEANS